MCGIFFSLHDTEASAVTLSVELRELLQHRGPDYHESVKLSLDIPGLSATAYSTVLSLRGPDAVTQPMASPRGGLLCFNGEAWRINGERVTGNDTQAVFDLLEAAAAEDAGRSYKTHDAMKENPVVRAIASISGPFAIVYFDRTTQRLYYARDRLGRRSLLWGFEEGSFALCSLAPLPGAWDPPNVGERMKRGWGEVSCSGIWTLECAAADYVGCTYDVICDCKVDDDDEEHDCSHDSAGKPLEDEDWFRIMRKSSDLVLWSSVSKVETLNKSKPLESRNPHADLTSMTAVGQLQDLLRSSMELRLTLPTNPSSREDSKNGFWQPARLAILFSGGLDCTIIARLAHDLLPPKAKIDLLNVAFENPHVHKLDKLKMEQVTPYDICPDRITAHASYQELKRVCCTDRFRLIEIDIPYSSVKEHRSRVISLMAPHGTEMDLSISLALYFASRGVGTVTDAASGQKCPCNSQARVLFSGLGADELFAGYQRHATAFKQTGYAGLLDELETDYDRLGERNLGRDDRIISHWGREARYPYLDEDLVDWAVKAPIGEKCGFGLERNDKEDDLSPDKLVLRLLARKLGMHGVAREKKRAIQFGARTAKMEGKTTGAAAIKRSLPPLSDT